MTDRELVDAYSRFRPVKCRLSLPELPRSITDHIPTEGFAEFRECDYEFLACELRDLDPDAATSVGRYLALSRAYTAIANRNDMAVFCSGGKVIRGFARRILARPEAADPGELFWRIVRTVRESGLFVHPLRLVVSPTDAATVQFGVPSLAGWETAVAAAVRVAVDTETDWRMSSRLIDPEVPGSRVDDWFFMNPPGEIPF